MKARYILSFIIALFFLSFSCSKEVIVPDLDGSLVGFIYIHDEYGKVLERHDNVLVTALGIQSFTTRTDKRGRFEFKELPAGTYEIHMEKEGFGTMKQFGIKHLGGKPTLLNQGESDDYIYAYFLYQTPTSSITQLSIELDTITAIADFNGIDPSNLNYGLMVYFSGTENFNLRDAEYITKSYTISSGTIYKGKINGLKIRFASGKRLAYKACLIISSYSFHHPVPVHPIESYFDFASNQNIYPNLGPESNEYTFIVP